MSAETAIDHRAQPRLASEAFGVRDDSVTDWARASAVLRTVLTPLRPGERDGGRPLGAREEASALVAQARVAAEDSGDHAVVALLATAERMLSPRAPRDEPWPDPPAPAGAAHETDSAVASPGRRDARSVPALPGRQSGGRLERKPRPAHREVPARAPPAPGAAGAVDGVAVARDRSRGRAAQPPPGGLLTAAHAAQAPAPAAAHRVRERVLSPQPRARSVVRYRRVRDARERGPPPRSRGPCRRGRGRLCARRAALPRRIPGGHALRGVGVRRARLPRRPLRRGDAPPRCAQPGPGPRNEAIACARRLLVHQTADEVAHQLIIRGQLAAGRRGDALRQYRCCVEALDREYGFAPSDETTTLCEQLTVGMGGTSPR